MTVASLSSTRKRSQHYFQSLRAATTAASGNGGLTSTGEKSESSILKATIKASNPQIDATAIGLGQDLHELLGVPYPSTIPVEDLQLQCARKIRYQLLQSSTCQSMLLSIHAKQWLAVLLDWLNLHDRPAVQMEALLVLTTLAEVCAQSTYGSSNSGGAGGSGSSRVSNALFSSGNGNDGSSNKSDSLDTSSLVSSGRYPYLPTPPLSFASTFSKDALLAFNNSIAAAFQQGKGGSGGGNSSLGSSANPTSGPSFLPPAASGAAASSNSFPQHLSANGQYLLLRHADAIPTLISLLTTSNQRDVYEQAVWILGTIAAGDNTGTGGSGGSSGGGSGSDGRGSGTGGSGNGGSNSNGSDKVAARDVILAAGVMNPLLRCMENHMTNLSLQRIGSWTLSHLVEGIFQQSSSKGGGGGKDSGSKSVNEYSSSDEIEMETLLPVLSALLRMADAEVLSYTCWTLSHLCDGPSSHLAAVVTTRYPRKKSRRADGKTTSPAPPSGGLVPRLVELLGHSSWRVTKPALRTIGNIVCAECSDDQHQGSNVPADFTEIILECNAVPKLKELVTHANREIQKEACWTLSNIAAGTVDQIQAVIDSGVIPPLVRLVQDKSTDQEVRSEACWVVLNATSCGSDAQIEILVDEGCVAVLGVLLGEASMVMMALEGLERVLQVEEAREAARSVIDEETPILVSAALIEKALGKQNTSAVHKRASRIWKHHFVSCALCHKSFSKHRTSDATFCEECKCYVCSNCDCTIYHLSYQEELWAEDEQKDDKKRNAKKSKKAKKKEKAKAKKEQQQQQLQLQQQQKYQQKQQVQVVTDDHSKKTKSSGVSGATIAKDNSTMDGGSYGTATSAGDEKVTAAAGNTAVGAETSKDVDDDAKSGSNEVNKQEGEDDDPQQQIDYVLYLQQTGSIIALAKLMDALENYENSDFDHDELAQIRHDHTGILNQ